MNIVGISREKSTPKCTALVMEHSISSALAEQFRTIYLQRQPSGIRIDVQGRLLLVQTGSITPEFVTFLEQCLTEAQKLKAEWPEVLQERKEAEQADRDESLERLAKRIKLPLL